MDKIIPEDYLKIKTLQDIRVSKNYIVWVETTAHLESSGYRSHLKLLNRKDDQLIQFTSGDKKDYQPRFSPDEKKLAFLSTRNDKPQIYLMNLFGGEALAITKEKYGVSDFVWNPKSNKILYRAATDFKSDKNEDKALTEFELKLLKEKEKEELRLKKDPIVIEELVYRTGTDYIPSYLKNQLFVLDLETKETKRITKKEFDYGNGVWKGDNEVIVGVKQDNPIDLTEYQYIVKINLIDNTETIITKLYNPMIFLFDLVVNKHNPDIILTNIMEENYEKSKLSQINKYAIIKGDNPIIINKKLNRSVSSISWISNDEALALVNDNGKSEIRLFNLNSMDFKSIYEPRFSISSYNAIDKNEIFAIGSSPERPSAIWKLVDGKFKLVYDPNQEYLKNKNICIPEEIWFENPEGIKFQGWFFVAKGKDSEKPPLILSIHGGPHVMWTNADSMWLEWQLQVSAGYSVLALNPIGSDGYGEEFLRKIAAKWGIEDARDLLIAVDKLVDKDRVDKNRLYLTGGSYAGYQVANIITKDHRFKAACAQRGVYDLQTLDAGSDFARFGELEYDGDLWSTRDLLWDHSPLSKAKEVNTPLLMIHSENDYRVPVSQAEIFFTALRSNGKEVRLVRYPEEGHELSRSGKPNHLIDRLKRMIQWFEDHK